MKLLRVTHSKYSNWKTQWNLSNHHFERSHRKWKAHCNTSQQYRTVVLSHYIVCRMFTACWVGACVWDVNAGRRQVPSDASGETWYRLLSAAQGWSKKGLNNTTVWKHIWAYRCTDRPVNLTDYSTWPKTNGDRNDSTSIHSGKMPYTSLLKCNLIQLGNGYKYANYAN